MGFVSGIIIIFLFYRTRVSSNIYDLFFGSSKYWPLSSWNFDLPLENYFATLIYCSNYSTSIWNCATLRYSLLWLLCYCNVFIGNFTACNVLAASTSEPFTLRNYGRRINCTYVALYPGTVQVIALGVGVSNFLGSVRTTETGTLRKVCTTLSLIVPLSDLCFQTYTDWSKCW